MQTATSNGITNSSDLNLSDDGGDSRLLMEPVHYIIIVLMFYMGGLTVLIIKYIQVCAINRLEERVDCKLTLLMMTAESMLSKRPVLRLYFFSLSYFCLIFVVFRSNDAVFMK